MVGEFIRRITKILRDNSTVITTSLGVGGTVATAYLTGKASFKAAEVIQDEQRRLDREEKSHPLDTKEKAQLVWKLYIPAAVTGAATVVCIVGGARITSKKAAAAYSLLAVSDRAFSEYKDKVVEQLGPKKEKEIRDQIAQDRVNQTPVVIVGGHGTVLCFEMLTGRYFMCSVEQLKHAMNLVNNKINRENEATLADFYYVVGLENTTYSHTQGWTVDRLLDLSISSVMSPEDRPAVCFEYNYVKQL